MSSIRSFYSTYKALRHNTRNFLIKEDYLRFSDFIYCFAHLRRIKNLSIRPIMLFGHDLSGLVKEELANNRDILTVFESILTYRFIQRLSQSGIKVRLAIDWFEGQVIDKAWNLALHRFYPGVRRVGYRPIESFPFYLCTYPIQIERDSKVIPDVIAVQGYGTTLSVREFLADLEVMIIPSFKSQHVWEFSKNHNDHAEISILVTLPISLTVSVRIIKRLIEAAENIKISGKKIKYILKAHPATSLIQLQKDLGIQIPNDFGFASEKSFPRLLSNAHVMITEASISSLEALACGVPVIIMENEEGITYDPIPKRIPEMLYRKIRSLPQLVDALRFYVNLTSEEIQLQEKHGKQIRQDYFEQISEAGIDRFMSLSS